MRTIPTDPASVAKVRARIRKTASCWLWEGAKDVRGYGQASIGTGKNRVKYQAHRFVYQIEKGGIPEGMFLDHLCHTPSCVNPDHLRPVTHKQNMENRKGAHKNSKTGVRGVQFIEGRRAGRKPYRVEVRHNNVRYHGGSFATLAEAEAVAIELRMKLHTHNSIDRAV